MDDFIRLTTTEDLMDGGLKAAAVDDHEFLVANVGGRYYVADARCPHMGGHLAEGTLDGTVIKCPRHHSEFDLADGHVVRWTDWEGVEAAVGKLLRHPRPLRVYEVQVQGGDIMVGPQKTPPAQE